MAFQTAIQNNIPFGLPGELCDDGPTRAGTHFMYSSGIPNIVGATAYTLTAGANIEANGVYQADSWTQVTAGGTGIWAGILCNPHVYVNRGTTAGGTFAPTMTLPDGMEAEFLVEGAMWVTITTTAAVGDILVYSTTTGALSTIANSATPTFAAGTAFVPGVGGGYTRISTFPVLTAGLAKIKL